jgi:PAS domain S-box-containing protein
LHGPNPHMPFTVPAETPAPPASLLPNALAACVWVRRLAIAVALVLGGSNLLIWLHGSVPQAMVDSGMMIMRMNTAVAITAGALALACLGAAPGTGRRRLGQALAIIPALLGALTAIQDLALLDFGIDQLFGPGTIPGDLAHTYVRHPGRMSFNAALALLFAGLSLLTLDASVLVGKCRIWLAPGLAMLAALPVSLALVGYLLKIENLTGLLRSTNILIHTALALVALALGVLAARPERPPVRRILSPGADGVLLRWTLPGSTVLLISLGWFVGRGRQAGLIIPGEGAALMLFGGLVLLFGLLIAASRAVGRQEARARAANEALRTGQERSRAIIDTALDAVLLMDSGGLIVDWNPAAERIFGWRRDEVLGRSLADCIIPEELRAVHNRGLAHLKATGEGPVFGKRLELPALRRDGTKFPVELSINPLPGTELSLFVGFLRDITQRQAVEEKLRSAKEAAEAASRAKDNFVAALSHELRTPLTPVLLSAAALRGDQRLPADVREQMAMMERNITLEARLIDDLLDLTRISRGKLPLRTEPCDTHSLLCHAVEIVRDEARGKKIALDLDLGAERFGITGDPARLQQVFWNLLKNSVKFTAAGGRIGIKTRDDTERDCLLIEVSDNGLGFTPEAAELIFQPFEQAGREGDHRLGGLGLGLAIARAIVDLHGGIIRAGSPGAGLGATFTIEFPGPIAPPHGMLSAETLESPGEQFTVARRILLVEDHEPTLGVLSRLLSRAGHVVITAQSVGAAQAVAATQNFDVLISDLGLPDGTGLELIAFLRASHPAFPAIAISGYGMEEDLQRTRDAGSAAHLVKPVDFDQLRRALRELSPAA